MKNYNEINMINKMKHSIGFDREKIKKGKFFFSRNHYSIDFCEDLELAVFYKLAEKHKGLSRYYSLTQKGLDMLSEILDCELIKRE